MILNELKVNNFGLYGGEQTLNLAPFGRNGSSKPITLFGGINGGGKTTLLDAVELALYGAQARCSKRSDGNYEQFLHECIHRGVAPSEGASVGLSFRYTSEGEEHVYELRRSWSLRRKRLREDVVVYKDQELNRAASDYWNELVQELIPIGLSQLFFFDAEKIRFLAEDETGDATLGASIKSLLGLDLAERLITDAAVLESRLAERSELSAASDELQRLQAEFKQHEEAALAKKAECAALENDRLRALNELEQVEEEFSNVGGKLWEKREAHQRRKTEMSGRKKELEQQLVAISASALPFALIPELLERVQSQDEQEQIAREARVVEKLLSKRDAQIVRQLKKDGIAGDAVEAVRQLQKKDRESRKSAAKTQVRLRLSDAARASLQHLQSRGLRDCADEASRLLDELDRVYRALEDAEHALEVTPADSDVTQIVDRLKEATKKSAVLNDRADKLGAKLKSLQFARDEAERKLQTLRRKQIDQQIRSEEASRMVRLTIRTQSTMKEFLGRATAAKIDRLSGLITDSFRFLLRKQTLVKTVQINPETFAITLFDGQGNAVPKKRLSEGEKQVFAISVLWGLAQASPRPLPAIIDTPMARLDAEHRNNLVQRYFPNASHQVIILSTDTEVDQHYYRDLHPHIARAYHLNYDESAKATQAQDGYFWEPKPSVLPQEPNR